MTKFIEGSRFIGSFLQPAPFRQPVGMTRVQYLRRAHRYCASKFAELRRIGIYLTCHESYAIRDVLQLTELRFLDLGTSGVEYIAPGKGKRSPEITYLNSGDTYAATILYIRGRFSVGCWGDVVERGAYD